MDNNNTPRKGNDHRNQGNQSISLDDTRFEKLRVPIRVALSAVNATVSRVTRSYRKIRNVRADTYSDRDGTQDWTFCNGERSKTSDKRDNIHTSLSETIIGTVIYDGVKRYHAPAVVSRSRSSDRSLAAQGERATGPTGPSPRAAGHVANQRSTPIMANQNDEGRREKSIDRDSVDRKADQLKRTREHRRTVDFAACEVHENIRRRREFFKLEDDVDEHGRFCIRERDSPENFLRTQHIVDLEAWR